jgi:hypothetical protein
VMRKLCKHGKKFCCECTYGRLSERDVLEKPVDAVEEMNRYKNKYHGIAREDRYDEDSHA